MLATLLALGPIFLLILLGHGMKRWQFVPDSFWPSTEKVTYYVTFPALLLVNTAQANPGTLAWGPIAVASAGATVAAAGLFLMARRAIGGADAAFSSGFQGAVRPNTYVGLAGAAALYGPPGVAVSAVCIAVVVPLVNVLAVSALVHYGAPAGGKDRRGRVMLAAAKGIARNPLILSCLLGAGLAVSGLGLPPVVGPLLEILGRASLPMGLLAVGAGLSFAALRGAPGPLIVSSLVKLGVLPLLAWGSCRGLGLDPVTTGAVVLYAGLPCSASAFVLARQMGGDAPLMANIITAQTLAAMVSLPAVVLLLG